MLQNILNKVAEKGAAMITKAAIEKGSKIAAAVAILIITNMLTAIWTSKYKDKVYNKLREQHDGETADRISKEFEEKIKRLQKEIAELRLSKEESRKRYEEGIRDICRRFNIDPDEILKSK